MAKTRKPKAISITREDMESLIYGKTMRRFTQDTPVLPDVWIDYAANPRKKLDLLISP
jgi:hypothetical protein